MAKVSQDVQYVVALVNGDGYSYDVPVMHLVDECKVWVADDGTLVVQDNSSDDVILYAAPGKWHSVRRVGSGSVQ